ncbi:MAG: hypothetical protein Q4D81_06270 [Eubacteriales bacterium]|nr:hypothetical protein [Eubacteriales bacterium]
MSEENKNIELNSDQLNKVAGGRAMKSSEKNSLDAFLKRVKQRSSCGVYSNAELQEAYSIEMEYRKLISRQSSGSDTYSIDQYLKDNGYSKYL